ncbi:MAG: hypothetical protein AAF633_20565 [Chloroflexota bacterium]
MLNGYVQLEQDWAARFRPKSPIPYPAWLSRHLRREQTLQQSERGEARQAAAIEKSIRDLEAFGIAEVVEITRSGLSILPLSYSSLSGHIFVEVAGLNDDVGAFMLNRALQLIDEAVSRAPRFRVGLAIHSLFSTSLKTIRLVQQRCEQDGMPLCLPLARHSAENEALLVGDGPLYHLPTFFKSDDRPHVPEQSAVRFAYEEGLLDLKPILIHLSARHQPEKELQIIAQTGCSVVLCPRSTQIWEGGDLPVKDLTRYGMQFALGSNSLAVVDSLDVREDLYLLKSAFNLPLESHLNQSLL